MSHVVQQDYFFTLAVGAGFLLIGLVIYSYLRPKPEHRPSVTALLGLLGFALVASPNWTRISIRSDGLELSLLREIEGRQLRALTALHERMSATAAAPEPAAVSAPMAPAATPAAEGPTDEASPEESPLSGSMESRGVGRRAVARDAEALEHLIDAYHRGELDLSALSDAELLALSDQVSAPRSWASRRP
jgi:xanthosine utilization system XapX-like protein